MQKTNQRMVFIVGVPRYGTTLVNYMLNSSSKISIAPETHFFDSFYKPYLNARNKEEVFKNYVKSEFFSYLELSDDEVNAIVDNIKAENAEDYCKYLFSDMLASYGKKSSTEIVGEKTPRHLEHFDLISKWYKNAKFIHVIRDPRDVSLSQDTVPWNSHSIAQRAIRWNAYMNLSSKYKEESPGKILEVRYEDLIYSPKSEMERISKFLSIDFEESMVRPTHNKKEVQGKSWKGKNKEPIDSKNMQKYINQMSLVDICLFQIINQENLLKHGYLIHKCNLLAKIRAYVKIGRLFVVDRIFNQGR
jgi:hypothetical protein